MISHNVCGCPLGSRLMMLQFADGEMRMGIVLRTCPNHFVWPFVLAGLNGRQWAMVNAGSGGPRSIPTYAEQITD